MVVYRLEIGNTVYPHNGIVCGIADALEVEGTCLEYGNATSPDKQDLIDIAHNCIEQLGDPDSVSYIPVPYEWSTRSDYYCFFTTTGIRRCMEVLVDLMDVCIKTGHPVVLWSTNTDDDSVVVYSDPYQVVLQLEDGSWESSIKHLFSFTEENKAKAALRMIRGDYRND